MGCHLTASLSVHNPSTPTEIIKQVGDLGKLCSGTDNLLCQYPSRIFNSWTKKSLPVTCTGPPRTTPNYLRHPTPLTLFYWLSVWVLAPCHLQGLTERAASWRSSTLSECTEGELLQRDRNYSHCILLNFSFWLFIYKFYLVAYLKWITLGNSHKKSELTGITR